MSKRKTSLMWDFFHQSGSGSDDKKAYCNVCKQNLSYRSSTTNLKKHLERKHPDLLNIKRNSISNDCSTDELNSSNIEIEELLEENILIEYCDDSEINEEKIDSSPKDIKKKILRIPISKNKPSVIKLHTERIEDDKDNPPKRASFDDSQYELSKIEVEIAKTDLKLKEQQLIFAGREDERRQREHEITMKIKEAQLQAILNRKINI